MDILLNDMASSNIVGHFQVSTYFKFLEMSIKINYSHKLSARRFDRSW